MNSVDFSDMGHVETLRETYNTDDLHDIMGRFYAAVSWREGDDE